MSGVARPVPAWLTAPRLCAAALLLLAVQLFLLGGLIATQSWFVDAAGHAAPADFLGFYAAASLAWGGEPAAAWDAVRMQAAQYALAGRDLGRFFPFYYPPTFLMVVTPLAALPFALAWTAWTLATLALFLAALHRVLGRMGWCLAAAAPVTFWCIVFGQNGFLTAGLMTAALVLLDRRPALAGLCLGLLTCKPHFGLLFPLVLLATGRWRVIAAATAATLGFAAAAALAFGPEVWAAFLAAGTGEATGVMAAGGSEHAPLQTPYALALRLGAAPAVAVAVHGALALAIAAATIALWRRGGPPEARHAALLAGAYLVAPHAYVYDAVMLVAAAAFLLRAAALRGVLRGELALIALATALPAFLTLLGGLTALPAALILLGLALRRGWQEAAVPR